ncbi:MAG: CAP domain-containing protein [Myxococcota bacterium]
MRRGGIHPGPWWGLLLSGCIFSIGNDEPVVVDEPDQEEVEERAPREDASDDSPTSTDPTGEVAAHNAVRASAQPPPVPALGPLTWDPELAEVARNWAEGCRFVHSQTSGLGENLYAASWAATIQEAVDSWAAEDAWYDYDTNSCSNVCGHYTQIVWRDTQRVGCGFADCPVIEGTNFGGRYWVCNYDPPGNFVGQRPY